MSESEDSIKDLKAEAKWASDTDGQKESIEELSAHGRKAIPALEEVKAVTAQDDIRKEVDAAIRGIQGSAAEKRTTGASRPRRKTAKKSKSTTRKKNRKK